MAYSKLNWKDNSAPYRNAENLNHQEQGIYDAHVLITALATGEEYKGTWTPQAGAEYPTPTKSGDSYYITGLGDSGYTFTGGDLTGRVANNNDKIIYNGTAWSMIDNTNCKDNLYLVNTIAEMTALSPVNGAVCNVGEAGRGGIFNYDDSQSGINDDGTIFDGWVRQYDKAINVKWFGAKGDGITDDSAAIQAALALGGIIDMNQGDIYLLSSLLNIKVEGTKLRMNGCKINTSASFSGDSLISITASFVEIEGQGCLINGTNINSPTTDFIGDDWVGFGITCRGVSSSAYKGIKISGINFEDIPAAAIGMEYANNCLLDNLSAYSCDNGVSFAGPGVYYINYSHNSFFSRLEANVFNWKGFGIRNGARFTVRDLICANGVSDQAGAFFSGCAQFTATSIVINNGFGIKIDDCYGATIDNCSLNLGGIGEIGFMNQGSIGSTVSNIYIRDYAVSGIVHLNHTALDSLVSTITNFTITNGEVSSNAAIEIYGSASQEAGAIVFSSGYIYSCNRGVRVTSGIDFLNGNIQIKDITIDTFSMGVEGCSKDMVIDGIQFVNAAVSSSCILLYNGKSEPVNACSIVNCSTDILPDTVHFVYGYTEELKEIKIKNLIISNNTIVGGVRFMWIALNISGDYIRSLNMTGNNSTESISASIARLSNAIHTSTMQVCIVGNSMLMIGNTKGIFSFIETAETGVCNGVVENNMFTISNKPNDV